MNEIKERTLRTAARYLGMKLGEESCPGEESNPGETRMLEQAYEEMLSLAVPRHALRREGARVEGEVLRFAALPPIPSRNLCRLFAGCREGFALLITLGMGVDMGIRRLMITAPGLGAAVNACAAAYVDVCIEQILKEERAKAPGLRLTPRFSPGYGDVSLEIQPGLLRLLEGRRLGVSLTEGFMMIPEKSVTALMGILPEKSEG